MASAERPVGSCGDFVAECVYDWDEVCLAADGLCETRVWLTGEDEAGFGESSEALVDEDGDLVVRRTQTHQRNCIKIQRKVFTPLQDVGLQLWNGAYLLSDYLIHQRTALADTVIIDLGAGVGLTSIVASSICKCVYLTDFKDEILNLAKKNIEANILDKAANAQDIRVRRLDWLKGTDQFLYSITDDFSWNPDDIVALKDNRVIVIAADVIYDNELTDALFAFLSDLRNIVDYMCIFALEKRVNFTLQDLTVSSPSYERFREFMSVEGVDDPESEIPIQNRFDAQRKEINFKQNVQYERLEELELWEFKPKNVPR